ncbi:hypothetical protein BX616_001822 [Lobosporangium transversale]|uniref:Hepatocellular carcinoma-associated antigen 59-domain-containing protein n=1 Tax=Lobosporangium transversale TaxID=64571 RepID=A0A1Y2GM55_9FUNG|nr:hepatocellular carcinoma-associated antigen 59-domain-containing protein [Lobosporangium transversale]KAF9919087.1 hypothetical protein BX616_001822 [Lobosporangium transversale]ORZ13798.1 hepatocellular carcinoma-associated antigen 59-domain-containing protein [Lobosporangium transversale]|eukprot:XP_021880582.1 hepatocellular carcinoma-associated antigen 59-domain-containing protein [Lobosporangium transversale]
MSKVTKRRNYRKRETTPEEEADKDSSSGLAPSPSSSSSGATGDAATNREAEKEGLTLEELLELRKLRQRPAGIAATDLLIGDTTEKKKKKDKIVATDPWKLSSTGRLVDHQDDSEQKSTGILNSFTKQTNALDVDKHMMKYIEEEMRRRKGENATLDENTEEQNRTYNGDADILDELGIKKAAPKPEQEGNVQLSTTMLTAIPEVDLGMESRLKNIEETEKAKRKLYEERTTTSINPERFSQPAYIPSDRERISHHQQNNRRNNNNNHSDSATGANHRFQNTYGQHNRGGVGRGMATDDLVMERFKKRMRR